MLLIAYFLVYYCNWFTVEKRPVNWTVLQLHLSVGITILALAIARIIWRLINVVPSPEPGSRTQHLVIKVGHYSLYVMMLMMPVTGYLGTGANIDFYGLFKIDKFENTQIFTEVVTQKMNLTFSEFEKPVDFIHKQVMGTWLV